MCYNTYEWKLKMENIEIMLQRLERRNMMILYQNTFKDVSLKEVKDFPREDWYWAEDNVAVVADGITIDSILKKNNINVYKLSKLTRVLFRNMLMETYTE